MSAGDLTILIFVAACVIAATSFNILALNRRRVDQRWADIDAKFKRRAELIPQLMSAVKGYAAHDRSLFDDIGFRRSAAHSAANDMSARCAAERALADPVRRLIALGDEYPELKVSDEFIALRTELAALEDKIEKACGKYDRAVRAYNASVATFPSSVLAKLLGYSRRPMLKV